MLYNKALLNAPAQVLCHKVSYHNTVSESKGYMVFIKAIAVLF